MTNTAVSNPLILALETSGPHCSVALGRAGDNIVTREGREINDHSSVLTPLIEELLEEMRLKMRELSAVAVSIGPGSYTGLRIGLATGKGIAFALNVPLITIPTLELLAASIAKRVNIAKNEKKTALCPMIDARRQEVYTQGFSLDLEPLNDPSAHIFPATLPTILEADYVYYGGSGAEKAAAFLDAQKWRHVNGAMPTAELMVSLANRKYHNHAYANLAYCEPLYLKEFIAAPPKPSVLDAARAAHSQLPPRTESE